MLLASLSTDQRWQGNRVAERTTLDAVLSAEAQARHKIELERYNQIYGRAGILLLVLAVYLNLLARFLDKQPEPGNWVFVAFAFSSCMLALSAVLGLVFVLCAVLGRRVSHPALPEDWKRYAEGDLSRHFRSHYSLTDGEAEERIEREISAQVLAGYMTCASENFRTNTVRFAWLFRATVALVAGAPALIVAVVFYILLPLKAPPVVSIRVAEPVSLSGRLNCETRAKDVTMSEEKPKNTPEQGKAQPSAPSKPIPPVPQGPQPIRVVDGGSRIPKNK